jgi:hypothetical protein
MADQRLTTALGETEAFAVLRSQSIVAPARHVSRAAERDQACTRSRSKLGLLPAIVFAVLAFFAVSALETFSINPDRPAAILFPETVSRDQAFAAVVAAGGLPIRPGRSHLSDGIVWIAAAGTPDFFDKVKSHGAWAVINPFAFGGCFLVTPT